MSYYNQYNYKSVPYPSQSRPSATIATSGCGVCCMSMVVEALTGKTVTPQTMAKYSIKVGARLNSGTDMHTLGKAASDKWGLTMTTSSDIADVLAAVRQGGVVIANVGGDRGSYKGLFSNGGHYVVVAGITSGRLVVHDPGQYDGKYSTSSRTGRVQVVGHDIRVLPAHLDADCSNREPRYYIFEGATTLTDKEFEEYMDRYLAHRGALITSAWAEREVDEAMEMGITDGTRPQSFATRQEVAIMVKRMMRKVQG